ncbi:unnamed protein product [Camellia sinensis]
MGYARPHHPKQYSALYIIAVGAGGTKPNISTFGADQFDDINPHEKKLKVSFFNWWMFSSFIGGLVATLGLVYIQENLGWGLGYGTRLGRQSPGEDMVRVIVNAFANRRVKVPSQPSELHEFGLQHYINCRKRKVHHTPNFRSCSCCLSGERDCKFCVLMKKTLRYLAGVAGPSGYGSNSTAEQVTQQDCSFLLPSSQAQLTALVTVFAQKSSDMILHSHNWQPQGAKQRLLSGLRSILIFLGVLRHLYRILRNNNISGSIPSNIGDYQRLLQLTTKRKELHGTTCVHALSGTWGLKPDGTVFQAYRIHFTCNIPDEKEKMNKENTHRQSSEPEEKNKEREVTTEREDGRKEMEETYARKEHFHPSTRKKPNKAKRPKQGFEQLDRFDSLPWNSSLFENDDPFSISVGSSELEGGFLSLEEIDESEYGLEIPKPERENKKQRTKENKNEKKRKHSEVEDELGGEVEAVSEEKDNKVKRKKKKKKKKKKNKDAKNSEENEEPTAEIAPGITSVFFFSSYVLQATFTDILKQLDG